MMKTLSRSFLISSATFLGAVSIACASPILDVKITTSSGKVVYRGKTDSEGMFTTKSLEPGNYVVQFNAATSVKGGPLALMVHAGKQETSADSVPASKFNQGGVAMKIELSSAIALTGQVAPAGTKMANTSTTSSNSPKTSTSAGTKSKLKTKVVNGKTLVWIKGDDAMGSSFGGHWAPEGSPEAKIAESNSR